MTYRVEDLPFTIEGIVPDIIINPHAIPSHTTIGHVVESLAGKVAAIAGKAEADCTPFQTDAHQTVDNVSRQPHRLGYQIRGNEVMYNPHTDRKMDAQIFFCPILSEVKAYGG